MTKRVLEAVVVAGLLAAAQEAMATPSTTFWTPATTYTQPFLVPHLTYDSYVAEKGALQNDYGLTVGVIPGDKLQGEVGFDLFLPTPGHGLGDFLQLNAKLTLPEGALAPWQPGVSAGVMNLGFKKDVSDYGLLHAEVGKAFPFGTVAAGGYYGAGSKLLWTGSDGEVHRAGFMASYTSPDLVLDLPGLQKLNLLADLSTGKNWMGAVGGGLAIYFTPAIDLITGPVFFLDGDYYKGGYGTDVLWTFQIDVDFDLMKKPPAAPKT
jgi:hypothetical protein